MKADKNALDQPIGFAIDNWRTCSTPPNAPMTGQYCRLERLDLKQHASGLFEAFSKDTDGHNWTYMPYGPFDTLQDFTAWLSSVAGGNDPFFHSIIDLRTGQAVGVASYLRISPTDGVIEVGHIHFSPLLQATTLATEAMFLMMQRVFDELGYRRYEWKCDALNAPSRRAAKRLGFSYEGVFRQATMYKDRNRDTAWFAIIDQDWPRIRSAYKAWLSSNNFDAQGKQKSALKAATQS